MKVIQNKLNRSLSGRVITGGGWHQMLHRRASGARQREDERRSPVATGRANAARGGALVTGPAILPVSFLMVLSFLYINIYVGNALMNSSAVTESNEVTVQDESMLTIGFVDDGGNPTTNTTNIALQPTADGVFNSGNVNVNVDTNSPLGYTLTMSASTSSLSRSEAVGNTTPVIPTLTTAVAQADFPNNYWGYKRTASTLDGATEQIADTLYQPMRENYNIPISSTGASASKSISTVNFGVKLDTNTPSGNYNININFLAVSNVAPNLAYMQDATSISLAAAMPSVGDTTVLYDRRDNKEYTIAKLADGKYWMTKNLDLDGGTPLYSSDSDVPAGYDTEPYYTLPASQKITSGTTLDGGFDNDGAAYAYVYNSPNKTDSCGSGCYSYYSYNAATAMSGTSINADDTDAPYSICPAGWRLPTSRTTVALAQGTPGSDFYKMAIHYGLKDSVVKEDPDNDGMNFCTLGGDCGTNTVPRFLRAGYYYGSTFYAGGTRGYYWSSTASSSTSAHNLAFYSGAVYSANNYGRGYGFSVRCLFDATMQNFTSEDAAAMALHQEEVLVDARDGKNYYVTKLKDGNVWMTQNLDFDITGPLDSTTTNLTVSGEAPYVTDYTKDNTTGIITWTPSATTISAPAINQAFTWSDNPNNPESVDLGDWYYRSDYYNNDDCSGQGCNYYTGNAGSQFSQTPGTNGAHSHVGNYYNWSAAVASSNTSGYDSGNAVNSLCPANWNLPANGMYGTLNSLYNPDITIDEELGSTAAADKALLAAPLCFVRAGTVWSSALRNAGHFGVYWSSTVYSSSNAHNLSFLSSGVWPADGSGRGRGRSLRCVLSTE
ncbi:hypothetical protein IKG68_01900 [Candidatus Saccharibacteria bacterium]|nr:hypothetical protein [Candidatus Saccharibacteria bacterium]